MTHTTIQIKSTPKDVFMHLLMFVCLYISTFSFIALIFDYINQFFQDPLTYYYDWSSSALRYEVASLIIVFPLYIFLANLIERGFKKEPGRHEIKIRKWLVYLTLFIAAITIIFELVTLVNNFLGGELTLISVLKILTVLLVTAAVFGYYFFDARDNNTLPKKKIAWATGIVVAIAVISAFFIIGSPLSQRERRFDNTRINDLQIIQNAVVDYYYQTEKLPAKMDDLTTVLSFHAPTDPQNIGVPYEYRLVDATHFEVCANFNLDTPIGPKGMPDSYYDNTSWSHGSGPTCFKRDIKFFLSNNNPPFTKPIPFR